MAEKIILKKESEIDQLEILIHEKNEAIKALHQEEANLIEELSRLGFFKGRRKKEIAALLDAIPERIRQVEKEYETKKLTSIRC